MKKATQTKQWTGECLRKKKFKSFDFAERTAKLIGEKAGKEFRVYMCPHCCNFHLTTWIE